MQNKWYWIFRNIIFGPFLRVYNRPEIVGVDNIPSTGPAIIASNHQSVMDSFFLPLLCPRQITFLAKAEYFNGTTPVGRLQKWFFTNVGQRPVNRTSASAGQDALNTAVEVLNDGDLFGIYPEGTRSPDGRLYKGKTGVARIALASGAQVIPVAMIGTRDVNPIGTWFPRPGKVRVKVGDPIYPIEFVNNRGLERDSYEAIRALTDHIMRQLQQLSGQEYADVYAAEVKKALAEGGDSSLHNP